MIKAGTKITCAWCKVDLYIMAHDLLDGCVINYTLFEPIREAKELGYNSSLICFKCKEPFSLGISLHTEYGWRPHKPMFFNKTMDLPD